MRLRAACLKFYISKGGHVCILTFEHEEKMKGILRSRYITFRFACRDGNVQLVYYIFLHELIELGRFIVYNRLERFSYKATIGE
jgi:UV DNA damage repair endonuclease